MSSGFSAPFNTDGSEDDLEDMAVQRVEELVVGFPHLKPTFYNLLQYHGLDIATALQRAQDVGISVPGGAPLTVGHLITIRGLLAQGALLTRGLGPAASDSSYSSGEEGSNYSGSVDTPTVVTPPAPAPAGHTAAAPARQLMQTPPRPVAKEGQGTPRKRPSLSPEF